MLGSTQRVFSCYGIPRSCRDSEGCTTCATVQHWLSKKHVLESVRHDPANPSLGAYIQLGATLTSRHPGVTSQHPELGHIPNSLVAPTWSQRIVTAVAEEDMVMDEQPLAMLVVLELSGVGPGPCNRLDGTKQHMWHGGQVQPLAGCPLTTSIHYP